MKHSTSTENWIPLTISFIEYPEGDLIGKFLAFVSITPLFVLAGFVALILFRRDVQTISTFIGLLLNELLNAFLKRVIAEPRPLQRPSLFLHNEYGMPSSHCQFVWFLSTYMFYYLFIRTNFGKNSYTDYIYKLALAFGFFTWSTLMAISRVYLKYHTTEQVLCGSLVGVILASFWFTLTQYIFSRTFGVITSWKISEFLLIRDTTLIPNIFWFEYSNVRKEVERIVKAYSKKTQ